VYDVLPTLKTCSSLKVLDSDSCSSYGIIPSRLLRGHAYATIRNMAFDTISFRHPFVLGVDGDAC